jgi:hypothetical protein
MIVQEAKHMPVRVAIAALALTVGITSAATAERYEGVAPLSGRVTVGTSGHLTQQAIACPDLGNMRMLSGVLRKQGSSWAELAAVDLGCFDMDVGEKVSVEEGMPVYDPQPSHICVRATPHQKTCVWILNYGVKAD